MSPTVPLSRQRSTSHLLCQANWRIHRSMPSHERSTSHASWDLSHAGLLLAFVLMFAYRRRDASWSRGAVEPDRPRIRTGGWPSRPRVVLSLTDTAISRYPMPPPHPPSWYVLLVMAEVRRQAILQACTVRPPIILANTQLETPLLLTMPRDIMDMRKLDIIPN